jgi:hypothetical protein
LKAFFIFESRVYVATAYKFKPSSECSHFQFVPAQKHIQSMWAISMIDGEPQLGVSKVKPGSKTTCIEYESNNRGGLLVLVESYKKHLAL